MAKFIQELDRVDFKNTTTEMIEVGDIVPIGKMHGVAITNIGPNSIGAVKVTGCFEGVALTEKRPGTTVLEVALVPNVEK